MIFERQIAERKTDTGAEGRCRERPLLCTGMFLGLLQQLGPGQSQELHSGSLYECKGPSTWVILCLPRHICRKLVWKWVNWNPNWSPYVIWHCRWRLNPVQHNTSPAIFIVNTCSALGRKPYLCNQLLSYPLPHLHFKFL